MYNNFFDTTSLILTNTFYYMVVFFVIFVIWSFFKIIISALLRLFPNSSRDFFRIFFNVLLVLLILAFFGINLFPDILNFFKKLSYVSLYLTGGLLSLIFNWFLLILFIFLGFNLIRVLIFEIVLFFAALSVFSFERILKSILKILFFLFLTILLIQIFLVIIYY